MDLIVNEMLLDCLNTAKIVFKNGLTGAIVLGDKYQRVFTALPEYFTVSDHDIRIVTSSDITKDLEQIKSIIPTFIQAGSLSPDIIMEAITCKSVPDLKYKVKKAMQIQRQENNEKQQLKQKLEQVQDQLKEATKQLQKAQTEIKNLNQDKINLEKKEMQMKYQVEWYKSKTERKYREGLVEEAKRRTEAELAQIADGNPYNDQIRQI